MTARVLDLPCSPSSHTWRLMSEARARQARRQRDALAAEATRRELALLRQQTCRRELADGAAAVLRLACRESR